MNLSVTAEVKGTEDKEKVLKAVENLFPSLEFEEKEGVLVGAGVDRNDLAAFKELLKIQQIRGTAKGFLFKHHGAGKLIFDLNKQAAFMGKVNFVDFEIALGTIRVEVEEKELDGLIEWLCD